MSESEVITGLFTLLGVVVGALITGVTGLILWYRRRRGVAALLYLEIRQTVIYVEAFLRLHEQLVVPRQYRSVGDVGIRDPATNKEPGFETCEPSPGTHAPEVLAFEHVVVEVLS